MAVPRATLQVPGDIAARRFEGLGLRVTREIEIVEPVENLARIPRNAGAAADPSDEADSESAR